MSATAAAASTIDPRHRHGKITWGILDAIAAARRNLIALKRVPQLFVFSTVQPVIFVLLFRYIFGEGAIQIPGGIPYVDFLMPGIFVQTTVFGAIGSAVGLANDVNTGLLERFRSLPMSRSAVVAGRTLADLVRNIFVMGLMVGVGYLVDFRIHIGVRPFLAGILLLLLFGYALSWIFVGIGLAVGNPESAQAAAFPLIAPLVFASSVFVPIHTLPGWLRDFATYQPVSATTSAVRALTIGGETASYVWQSIGWSVGLLLIFVPLAVRLYRRAV